MNTVIFNVHCPHCGKALQAEITGFCRTGLNSRIKMCKYCHNEYAMTFIAETNKSVENTDIVMSELRERLKLLKIEQTAARIQMERQIDTFHRN